LFKRRFLVTCGGRRAERAQSPRCRSGPETGGQ
jgi:hypothetical protein